MSETNRTKEQILVDLKALHDPRDPEGAHINADDLLVEFVRLLGHDDVADAYEAIAPKWYA